MMVMVVLMMILDREVLYMSSFMCQKVVLQGLGLGTLGDTQDGTTLVVIQWGC